jgi:hypothetical protein
MYIENEAEDFLKFMVKEIVMIEASKNRTDSLYPKATFR